MPTYAAPFDMGALVLTAIEGFLSGAALHLGETLPDGRGLEKRDPQEAWRGLMAAGALLAQFAPLMDAAALAPYQARLVAGTRAIAQQFPDVEFRVPAWMADELQNKPVASLQSVAADAWRDAGLG
jgi:hypothetical protein